MPDLSDTIESLATTPASASADGQSVTARSVDEVVKADKHLAEKEAVSAPSVGLRIFQLKPPGAV